MNAVAEILEHLNAIDGELQSLLQTPLQIDAAALRLNQARAELLARHGGITNIRQMHAMAVDDLYLDQANGRHLD